MKTLSQNVFSLPSEWAFVTQPCPDFSAASLQDQPGFCP